MEGECKPRQKQSAIDIVKKIQISPSKLTDKKLNKTAVAKAVISNICALLNCNGGKIILDFADKNSSNKEVGDSIRIIEQWIINFTGPTLMASNIKITRQPQNIVLEIRGYYQLCTVNYNLCLPSHTQVNAVPSHEPVEKIRDILRGKRPMCTGVTPFGSHKTDFVQGQDFGLNESYHTQFKQLKSSPSKCVSLADRMIGKGTKLVCYVSAFANYSGGNIYYGINDDGTVQGETITEKDRNEIVKKIHKTISKMVWFSCGCKPKKRQHWDIYFEPVKDTKGNYVESTFVVVTAVAQYLHGVFTEEPESYHIDSDGKVSKMSLETWKKRLMAEESPKETKYGAESKPKSTDDEMEPTGETRNSSIIPVESRSQGDEKLPRSLGRCDWCSEHLKKQYCKLSGVLIRLVNDGRWKEFNRLAKVEEGKCLQAEGGLKLVISYMKITADYKNGKFHEAEKGITEYDNCLSSSRDRVIFEVREILLKSALERSKGNHLQSYEIAVSGLSKVDQMPAGIIVAEYYGNFASVITIRLSHECDPQARSSLKQEAIFFFRNALEHLKIALDYPPSTIDQEQKMHINLAFLHLGCSFTGEVLEEQVDDEAISKAVSSLKAVDERTYEGYSLSNYRNCQYLLALSALNYRRSQNVEMDEFDDRESICLNSALKYSEDAKDIAYKCNFDEMLLSSRRYIAICTEKLLVLHVTRRSKNNE